MIKALILAGGKGARLRPLALQIPKPVVPLANIPFLFFQIDRIKRAGITELILSLSYQPRKIMDIFGDGTRYGMVIRYTHEELPRGTAGAFKAAENLIDDTTVVLNGDVLTDTDLKDVIRHHQEKQAEATIVTARVLNPAGYGLVEADAQGRVLRFTEKPAEDEITGDTINAGIYVLERSILDLIPAEGSQSFERDIFPAMVQRGLKVYASLEALASGGQVSAAGAGWVEAWAWAGAGEADSGAVGSGAASVAAAGARSTPARLSMAVITSSGTPMSLR